MTEKHWRSNLIESYNNHAMERDAYTVDAWKVEERANFLSLLQQEHRQSLIEIGAGAGKDSKFFQDQGLAVTCIDLSPEMVKLCRQKGLAAHVMDMTRLDFAPSSFDAVYSLNSLLHIPKIEFPIVLENVKKVLKPTGLFYLGVYGGEEFEGIWELDSYTPKRFFSFHSDENIQKITSEVFDLLSFKPLNVNSNNLHFQALILRKQQA
ncbi:MAG TPA: class I SAM-dependent methyltransferase [Anaerolineales bacterium]|nr:class I SAM-dependent methyltransferase [Anaerolineales bacterium]